MTANQSTSPADIGTLKGSGREPDLFPLPLAPFERYMLLDDRDDYPMAIVLTVDLTGDLRRIEFESALQSALDRHPLLTCRVKPTQGTGPCWVPARDSRLPVDWSDDDRPVTCEPRERIDITREPGVRIWVRRQPNAARVIFQIHHACCDGLGAVQFVGDLLACYGRTTAVEGSEIPELELLDANRLRFRATFSDIESQTTPKSCLSPWRLAGRLTKLLRRGPVPLIAGRSPRSLSTPSDLAFPATVSRIVDRATVLKLKSVASQKAVTVNDLYLLEMFQTIRQWNREHGGSSPWDWFRIGMPTSLRTPLHDAMPAANVVSHFFLTRRAGECDQPDDMLQDIHRRTSVVVNDQQGRFLAIGLKYVLKIPGLLNVLLHFNRCFATSILANVGEIRRGFTATFPLKQGRCVAGNVTLEGLFGIAPVRPNTRLSTSLGTYAGKLFINMHCDPNSFTRQQAEDLIDLFVRRLEAAAGIEEIFDRRVA
jgi:hypothetical protein